MEWRPCRQLADWTTWNWRCLRSPSRPLSSEPTPAMVNRMRVAQLVGEPPKAGINDPSEHAGALCCELSSHTEWAVDCDSLTRVSKVQPAVGLAVTPRVRLCARRS